jgi:hypothetical protein
VALAGIPYRTATAKHLRYQPDIYARYGINGGVCQPTVPPKQASAGARAGAHNPPLITKTRCSPIQCRTEALRGMRPGVRRDDTICYLLLRESVLPTLFHAPLEGRAGVHAREPGGKIRIRRELVEYFGHLADEAHLDIGAR